MGELDDCVDECYELLWALLVDGSIVPIEECMYCFGFVMYQGQAHSCPDFEGDSRETSEIDSLREVICRVSVRE
jgi:hypothetical protein